MSRGRHPLCQQNIRLEKQQEKKAKSGQSPVSAPWLSGWGFLSLALVMKPLALWVDSFPCWARYHPLLAPHTHRHVAALTWLCDCSRFYIVNENCLGQLVRLTVSTACGFHSFSLLTEKTPQNRHPANFSCLVASFEFSRQMDPTPPHLQFCRAPTEGTVSSPAHPPAGTSVSKNQLFHLSQLDADRNEWTSG